MSLSATLSNALTGLAVQSRSAQLVSSNVSNATNDDYSRRELQISTRIVGGTSAGVQIDGLVRVVDENLVRERRLAMAASGEANVQQEFYRDALDAIGQPENQSSLSASVVGFETALLEAASLPESDTRLQGVLNAAQSLASKLNSASDSIQTMREDVDRTIGQEIDRLNASLQQIAELNGQILRARGSDRDYPALLDSRQALIDDVSELIPMRQLQRDNDTVALYSMNGARLLDIDAVEFSFTPTAPIIADMTQASGALDGLEIDGVAIATSGEFGPIAGGRLAGLFAVRDEHAVDVQSNLDAMARDLVERFEDPTLDTTITAGDAGLFTDNGSALNVATVSGLASRLSINSLVDPTNGGELWRLRDGLGATVAGSVGDASLLNDMSERLVERRAPTGGTFTSTERTVSVFAADIVSITGLAFRSSSERVTFETARLTGLEDAMLADGVDTDQELQKLLLIEQAYAANARVIQTADELVRLLMGIL